MHFKDWMSLVIALLALSIASHSAWFEKIRVRNEIGIALSNDPILDWDAMRKDDKAKNRKPPPITVTFINSGNRPAAILHMLIYQVLLGSNSDSKDCLQSPYQGTFYRSEPFVIPAGDIVVRSFEYDGGFDGGGDPPRNKADFSCMDFGVVTPDSNVERLQVLLPGKDFWTKERKPAESKPWVLLKR